jgi:heme exporter protein D
MIWESWSAFWSMGGRGVFVWGSYGALLLAVIVELFMLKRARSEALNALTEPHEH